MPLDPSLAGRTYPPTTYLVGAEKVREFADAIGDPHPAFRDPAAAEALGHPDVIAPPTFATVLTLRAAEQVLGDDEVGVGLLPRGAR
jgi:acyl dehydratase